MNATIHGGLTFYPIEPRPMELKPYRKVVTFRTPLPEGYIAVATKCGDEGHTYLVKDGMAVAEIV